jgi:FMN reductase
MSEVVTISGSPAANARSAALLEYIRVALERRSIGSTSVDVRDFDPADLMFARWDSPQVRRVMDLVAQARVVIVATPVYKASYSGVLKTLFDLLPQNALYDKLVLPIAIGGSPSHLLSIDYSLRPVLTALGAEYILRGIYILDSQIRLVKDEPLQLDLEIEVRLLRAIDSLSAALLNPDVITMLPS